MKSATVFDEICVALDEIGVDAAGATPEARLAEDLELDSLDWVDLVLRIEERIGVTLREERFASIRTLRDVEDRVLEALSDGPARPT